MIEQLFDSLYGRGGTVTNDLRLKSKQGQGVREKSFISRTECFELMSVVGMLYGITPKLKDSRSLFVSSFEFL